MASSSPKKSYQDQFLLFEPTKPHFFKVVLDDTIRDRKLGIPRKFVRKYGNNLPGSIVLKVPSGENWQVELLKCDGEIWLKDGWQEFAEFYSIILGSFLLFEYDQRNGHFNVIIFDKSASEIDYPYGGEGDNEEPNNLEKAEKTSFKIFDEFMPSGRIKEESASPLPKPCRKMKLDNPTMPQTQKKRKLDNPTRKSEAKRCYGGRSSEKQKLKRVVVRTHPLTNAEKKVVLHRASIAFKTKNPFFMVVMQPAYLHSGRTGVYIPLIFARKYLTKECTDAILNLDGRTWFIRCLNHTMGGRLRPKIFKGWKQFSHDNLLGVGDVCVFELTNLAKYELIVTILRYNKASLGNKKELQHEKESASSKQFIKGPSIEDANKFTSRNPFFKVGVRSSHLNGSPMSVPLKFMAEHAKGSRENVTLQVKNKRWSVKLLSYASKCLLSAGLILFVRENSLRAGDVCILELINDETKVLKVSIFRNNNK